MEKNLQQDLTWWNHFLDNTQPEDFDMDKWDRIMSRHSDVACSWGIWGEVVMLMDDALRITKTIAETKNPCGEIWL